MKPRSFAGFALLAGCGRAALAQPDAALAVDAYEAPRAERNGCGGEARLAAAPGDRCGVCGVVVCASPERTACDDTGQRNACGACGPAPEELCNERDDDCDGVVDEGCVRRVAVLRESEGRVRLSGDRAAIDTGTAIAVVSLRDGAVTWLRPPAGDAGASRYYDRSAIDGDLVAYVRGDGSNLTRVVVAYDLSTGASYDVSDPALQADLPAVDRGRVVYETRSSSGDTDVWAWDLSTLRATRLTGPVADERAADVWGDTVVFERGPRGDSTFHTDIVTHDVVTGAERVLTEGLRGWARAPAIDGARVVWHQEEPGGNAPSYRAEIWLHDLSTGERRRLREYGRRFVPRVAGPLVCWSSFQSVHSSEGGVGDHVEVMDTRTDRVLPLAPRGFLCDLSARRVAFLENAGAADAFVRELLPEEP